MMFVFMFWFLNKLEAILGGSSCLVYDTFLSVIFVFMMVYLLTLYGSRAKILKPQWKTEYEEELTGGGGKLKMELQLSMDNDFCAFQTVIFS